MADASFSFRGTQRRVSDYFAGGAWSSGGKGADAARIPELDGIRAIAILMVLVWHYFSSQVSSEPGTLIASLIGLAKMSWSGVDLFFILSGFLIGGILIDNRGSSGVLKTFYVRRACRILPLYLVAVLTFFAARYFAGTDENWLFSGKLPICRI